MRPWRIYVLKDPRTDAVRYVGITHTNTRLAEHIFSAKRCRTHKASWVKSLLKAGLRPLMQVIETGVGAGWVERERFWIAAYRQQGANLVNHTEGGEGSLGWSPSPETRKRMGDNSRRVHTGLKRSPESRARMSEAQKRYRDGLKEKGVVVKCPPRSKETLERMAQAQRGKKASEVARKNMSLANSNPSSETRAKLAEASRSRDPEWKAWFAQNQKGKPKSAEHRAKISAAHKARRLNSSTVLPVTKGMTRKAGAS